MDQDGNVLDILVQSRREPRKPPNAFSANCAYGLQDVPRVIITDKLRSYGAAKREILQGWEHRQHKYLGHPSGELTSTHTTA